MARKINFILQEKGGTGKSVYTYLRALAEKDTSSLFVDGDYFAKSSSSQLLFLPEQRRTSIMMQSKWQKPDAVGFNDFLQGLLTLPLTDEVFIDFGSRESGQLLELMLTDPDIAPICDALGLDIHFHVIIAGGGAYTACEMYLKRIVAIVDPWLDLTVWQNQNTFRPFPKLADELFQTCEKLRIPLRKFADFEPESYLGSRILNGMINGFDLANYERGPMLRLKHELQVNFATE